MRGYSRPVATGRMPAGNVTSHLIVRWWSTLLAGSTGRRMACQSGAVSGTSASIGLAATAGVRVLRARNMGHLDGVVMDRYARMLAIRNDGHHRIDRTSDMH